jgi:hypothetical protein
MFDSRIQDINNIPTNILSSDLKLNLFFIPLYLLLLTALYIISFPPIYSQISEGDDANCKNKNNPDEILDANSVASNENFKEDPFTTDFSGFHHVTKFDREGNVIAAWGTKGTGPGEFLHAHGITIDSNGFVYVSDAEKCNIQKFDSDGNFITMWGTKGTGAGKFYQPEGLAVDSNDNVFVVDYSNKYIQKFDSDGNFITMWGTKGTGPGEFMKPWGIAVDSNDNIYVSDQDNPQVQKFDNNGKFLLKWGSFGSGDGQFVHLHDVTVDSNDFVFVTDGRNNSRVAKFDSEGNFVTKWGLLGCIDGQFLIPHAIATDSSGNVYVTDSGNVHFLADKTCESFENMNASTTRRILFRADISGSEVVSPVDTDVKGYVSLTATSDKTMIKYKVNISGLSDVTKANLHMLEKGQNGNVVVDLLKNGKEDKMDQKIGTVIRGDIVDWELVGPMRDKTMEDLIVSMSEGQTYVSISTTQHPQSWIGQVKFGNN